MKTQKYIINGLVLLGVSFISSCGGGSSTTKETKLEELKKIQSEIAALQMKEAALKKELDVKVTQRSKLVELDTIALGTFTSALSLEGVVDAKSSTVATSKVPAVVSEVLVSEGQFVKKGQILARLEQSSLLKSRLEIEQQLSFAKTLYEKQMRLWKNGIGTEVQYLSAKNQKEALEKSLNTLDANIDMYNIKSPIDGSIEAVDIKVGQTAAPGMPYFKVINMSTVKVVAQVSESYSGKINKGDKVKVNLPDLNKEISGTVSFASKFIDPLNRTFKVEVSLGNIEQIKPNMIAKVEIEDYANNKAISVPTNAIQITENESFVMILVDNSGKYTASKRSVKMGKSNNTHSEIVAGLNVDDMIIVTGFQELAEGQAVEIAK
ncbi:MAG: efflux RND transporter periplasmic adaptor subunit [Bacteroidia bacterium]|nr:efflux RND transporter periplasmic adaptor subunit [Bacteroidia bacterium]